MTETMIPDQEQRNNALDVSQSYIVQAPAGSGKTELLSQRFLNALAHCETVPEEVLAITFTKKAASEMRHRILQALLKASEPKPVEAHAQLTWELANKALNRDKQLQWQLLDNPNRLQIRTIDSLCASLTRQMPILSQFGCQPDITDEAQHCYEAAVDELLTHLESEQAWSDAIAALLAHLDNDFARIKPLLVALLAMREQWLPYVHLDDDATLIDYFYDVIQGIQQENIAKLETAIAQLPGERLDELFFAIRFAASNLTDTTSNTGIRCCEALETLPQGDNAFKQWQAVADFLLTKSQQWRKTVTAKNGFPAPSRTKDKEQKTLFEAMKNHMVELLAYLRDFEALRHCLIEIQATPPASFDTGSEQIILALRQLLPVLVAQLQVVFKERGSVDFSAISLAALTALGTDDAPTDLALYFDVKLRHILVDEFQDTSITQHNLLRKLTAGWETNDGRSLFVVGDPMQSIYRFRQAEVGLFLQSQLQGIGNIQLKPLQLTVNFRSEKSIVDWVNQTFQHVLPQYNDYVAGAISYSASDTIKADNPKATIQMHCEFHHNVVNGHHQAEAIAKLITNIRETDPTQSIAILVKSRSHLLDILPALQQAQLHYQAIEIENLASRDSIQSLLALTRALLHPADRIAWLALLRAPWCGLTLNDLYLLADDASQTLWESLNEATLIEQLTSDGQARCHFIQAVLQEALSQRRRLPLREWIETTWIALQGPNLLTSEADIADCDAFFDLLDRLETANDVEDINAIDDALSQLFASPNLDADGRLQIMTIHKSKGLEFDVVILPSLERRPPAEPHRLLTWLERPNQYGGTDVLLAPIKAIGEADCPVYSYIRRQHQQKDQFETGRLLYVAATRAKHELHLFANIRLQDESTLAEPAKGSFLSLLWQPMHQAIQQQWQDYAPTSNDDDGLAEFSVPRLTRTTLNTLVIPDATAPSISDDKNHPPALEPSTPRAVGTLVHRLLQQLSQSGTQNKDVLLQTPSLAIQLQLQLLGVPATEVPDAMTTVLACVNNTLACPKGHWLLSNEHQEAKAEYAITTQHKGKPQTLIIDRTFVDNDDVRWIVDYKTSQPDNGDVATFLAAEKATYAPQLQRYAAAIAATENRPIKLMLYFPLINDSVEWAYLP
mgnify:CR=1 FL=1